jgi:hypothetical protein
MSGHVVVPDWEGHAVRRQSIGGRQRLTTLGKPE